MKWNKKYNRYLIAALSVLLLLVIGIKMWGSTKPEKYEVVDDVSPAPMPENGEKQQPLSSNAKVLSSDVAKTAPVGKLVSPPPQVSGSMTYSLASTGVEGNAFIVLEEPVNVNAGFHGSTAEPREKSNYPAPTITTSYLNK